MNWVNCLKCFQCLGIFAGDSKASQKSNKSFRFSHLSEKWKDFSHCRAIYKVIVLYLEHHFQLDLACPSLSVIFRSPACNSNKLYHMLLITGHNKNKFMIVMSPISLLSFHLSDWDANCFSLPCCYLEE